MISIQQRALWLAAAYVIVSAATAPIYLLAAHIVG